jgi:acyl-CoA thioester hydrolase
MMEPFKLEFLVRDYECDLQGIVNNANYQHYLEHARHVYVDGLGIDFAELHQQGIDLVVAKIEMSFKTPLKSKDQFYVSVDMKKEGIKWVFTQEIRRIPDNKVVVKAKVDTVAIVQGKLSDYQPLEEAFNKHS